MKAKTLVFLLACLIAVQILVPGYTIFRHYDTLTTGEGYKFIVRPYDPYDPFRGRYVSLRTEEMTYETYAVLGRDAKGYASILPASGDEKPASGDYAKNLQLSRYYMNERMAPIAERIQFSMSDSDIMYLLVMVKAGHYVIEGLYLNGEPIEQYIVDGGL